MSDDDATLDDFLDDAPDSHASDADADTDATADERTRAATPSPSGESVEPATSTYAWAPGGGVCASCGERVEARWRDGDALVCAACKEW